MFKLTPTNAVKAVLLTSLVTMLSACGDKAATKIKDEAPLAPVIEETMSIAAPFVGAWHVARPDAPGVIVSVPMATCDSPVVISEGPMDGTDPTIIYKSPKGPVSSMALTSFNNRVTWMPMDNGPTSLIAEMKDEGKFWLYTANLGKADWDTPNEYIRCDG